MNNGDGLNDRLENVLRQEIPLTQAMGLRVVEATRSKVVLSAPLEPNHNHKQTAFGGSLYSLAVLAGWGLLWLKMKEAGLVGHVVIASTEVQYLKPVKEDFLATAEADEEALEMSVKIFQRKGRARAIVSTYIGLKNDPSLRFVGTYALVK